MPDILGDKFKAIEAEWKMVLPPNSFYVIRVDGRAFHTLTRGLTKPFDWDFIQAMDDTAMALVKEIQGAACAYVQSDEISIVGSDYQSEEAEHWFGGVVQKMASISAATATFSFNESLSEHKPGKRGLFDSRVFPLSTVAQVAMYLAWRQEDCYKNAISSFASAYYSEKQLHKKGTSQRIEMLEEAGVNPATLNPRLMHGGFLHTVPRTFTREEDGTEYTRNQWVLDSMENIELWFIDHYLEIRDD